MAESPFLEVLVSRGGVALRDGQRALDRLGLDLGI